MDNDLHWEPAARNFPVLLVGGDIHFNWQGHHNLRESMAGVNYNPSHTPYLGQSDTDQTDEYPPMIKGLVYVSGKFDVDHECVLEGVVVTDELKAESDLTITYDPIFLNNPPPGLGQATRWCSLPVAGGVRYQTGRTVPNCDLKLAEVYQSGALMVRRYDARCGVWVSANRPK